MLDEDAFDFEKLRISCEINLKTFKNTTCVKDLSVVPKTQKNEFKVHTCASSKVWAFKNHFHYLSVV